MKVAVLCGGGELSKLSIASLLSQNIETIAIVFDDPEMAAELKSLVPITYNLHIAKAGKMLSTLKKENITHVFMVGKIHINIMEGKLRPDLRALWILFTLKKRTTDSIMLTIINLFSKHGIETIDQAIILRGILSREGVFTKEKLTDEMLATVKNAYRVALMSSKLDVGQTVVAKGDKIVAIEAAEGTDKAVARGCKIAGNDAIVVKVAGLKQDTRFDLPTVGLQTLQSIHENGGKVLAIESGLTIIVDFDKCVEYADTHALIFLAFNKDTMEV